MAGRRPSEEERRRVELRARLRDKLRRFEAPRESVHIFERDTGEKYTAGHVAIWVIISVIIGIVLGYCSRG